MSFERNQEVFGSAEESINDINNESMSDSIGETVFSKHWLFSCLLNTLKLLKDESKSDPNNIEDNPVSDDSTQVMVELDSEADEELSILWDMSANEEVMLFLNDNKAIDLFEAIIRNTNSPRFAEISAGILANIANNDSICVNLTNKDGLRDLIIDLIDSSDTPFVIQLIRLINTSISNNEVKTLWLTAISSKNIHFFTTINTILNNCLNCDLLKSVLVLMNNLLYIEDSMSELWFQSDQQKECLKCLVEASDQLITDDMENTEQLDYFWLIMHSLSLSDQNSFSTQMNGLENQVLYLFQHYITVCFGDSVDYIISSDRKAGSLSASISICHPIIESSTLESKFKFCNNSSLKECFSNLFVNCEQSLQQLSQSSGEQSFQLALDQLKDILQLYSSNNKSNIETENTRTR